MSATYEPLCEHGRRLKDCALCRPVEEVRTGINVYVCQKCGGYTVTIDVDEGVTPFMAPSAGRQRMAISQRNGPVDEWNAGLAETPIGAPVTGPGGQE